MYKEQYRAKNREAIKARTKNCLLKMKTERPEAYEIRKKREQEYLQKWMKKRKLEQAKNGEEHSGQLQQTSERGKQIQPARAGSKARNTEKGDKEASAERQAGEKVGAGRAKRKKGSSPAREAQDVLSKVDQLIPERGHVSMTTHSGAGDQNPPGSIQHTLNELDRLIPD